MHRILVLQQLQFEHEQWHLERIQVWNQSMCEHVGYTDSSVLKTLRQAVEVCCVLQLETLGSFLEQLQAHDVICRLRNALAIPKVLYVL